MNILDLLRSDASIVVNKFLAREIGLNETVILSELISRYKWHQSEGKDKNGWFYCTKDTLEEQTSLNRYYQDKAINNLLELDLIDKKTTGIPAKRYFYINEKTVASLVMSKNVKDLQTRKAHSNKQESDIVANKDGTESQEVIRINNNHNDNKDNRSSDKSDKQGDEFSITKKDNGCYNYPEDYEKLYSLYPYQRGNKKAGWRKWAATRRKGISQKDLITAAKNYARLCKKQNTDKKWIMHIKTFLGPDEHWKEYLEVDESETKEKEQARAADF